MDSAQGAQISSALMAEMRPLLITFCRRYLADASLADDAVQETFAIALRSIGSLRDPSRIRAWLYTIARRESLRLLPVRTTTPLSDDHPDVHTPTPEAQLISADMVDGIAKGLDALPTLYRQAVVLRDMEGFTYAEIAVATGATLASVKFRIFKGREMLMERLMPFMKEWRTP